MTRPNATRMRVNGSVGAFLVLSGAGFSVFLDEALYATLCVVIGGLFLAKSMADFRILAE
ncbi:hypothetical protein [Halorubrum sp. DTA98]|uniref:hypothetical protein n=1 Tax=Halorubrum sp. DTA98 TaxID=3402163 RepID=UPI003AAFAD65